MSRAPQVPCPTCKGKSTIDMSPRLRETFALFPRGKRLTSADVHTLLESGSSTNSVNNRLEDLRKLGFLDRKRTGKYWSYFRAPKTQLPVKK